MGGHSGNNLGANRSAPRAVGNARAAYRQSKPGRVARLLSSETGRAFFSQPVTGQAPCYRNNVNLSRRILSVHDVRVARRLLTAEFAHLPEPCAPSVLSLSDAWIGSRVAVFSEGVLRTAALMAVVPWDIQPEVNDNDV